MQTAASKSKLCGSPAAVAIYTIIGMDDRRAHLDQRYVDRDANPAARLTDADVAPVDSENLLSCRAMPGFGDDVTQTFFKVV